MVSIYFECKITFQVLNIQGDMLQKRAFLLFLVFFMIHPEFERMIMYMIRHDSGEILPFCVQSLLLQAFLVFRWGHSEYGLEIFGKALYGVVAYEVCYLGDVRVALFQ